jgi:hypothetical protein
MLREYKARGGTDVQQGFIFGRQGDRVQKVVRKKHHCIIPKRTNQPFQNISTRLLQWRTKPHTGKRHWESERRARKRGPDLVFFLLFI